MNSEEELNEPQQPGADRKQARKRRRSAVLAMCAGLVFAGLLVGVIVAIKAAQFKAMADAKSQQTIPPAAVHDVRVREEAWQPRVSAVGSLTAVRGVEVSTEADGVVRRLEFEAGSSVETGDLLLQLDVEVEEAQLRAAQAAAELAEVSFHRASGLISTRGISQAELDAADAEWKQAQAQIENIQAQIAKKMVRAPFAGKLGIRRVSVGEFLSKGSPIVSLQSLDPIYAEFSVPQQRLGELDEGLGVQVAVDAYPGKIFEGTVTAINPNVDPATRNVRIQATLQNEDGRLRPGMFVSVEVGLPATQQVLLIPSTAVVHGAASDSVFRILNVHTNGTESLFAREQQVQLGSRRGDFVVVRDGLKAGDRIVAVGGFKLQSGMPVMVDTSPAPEFSLAPRPGNH